MSQPPARCSWATNELLIAYHDNEYGKLTPSDNAIFEKICLESFSSGLSWYIVLRKREALRVAFCGFDPIKCADLTDETLNAAMENSDIIRNRRKIEAVRTNARACLTILEEHESLLEFVCRYTSGADLAHAMRRYGVRQFGPVCAEELLKSLGMLPAHESGCDFANEPQLESGAECRHS